jgi:hypothetical protein
MDRCAKLLRWAWLAGYGLLHIAKQVADAKEVPELMMITNTLILILALAYYIQFIWRNSIPPQIPSLPKKFFTKNLTLLMLEGACEDFEAEGRIFELFEAEM